MLELQLMFNQFILHITQTNGVIKHFHKSKLVIKKLSCKVTWLNRHFLKIYMKASFGGTYRYTTLELINNLRSSLSFVDILLQSKKSIRVINWLKAEALNSN